MTADYKNLKKLAIESIVQDQHGLQFDATLEQRFEHYYNLRYLALNRIYLLVGALAMAIITMVDQLILTFSASSIIEIRLPTIAGLMFIYVLMQTKLMVPGLPILLCLSALTIHVSLLVALVCAAAAGDSHYHGIALTGVIFTCMMLRLQFKYVLPLAILLWFTHIIGLHFFTTQAFDEFLEILVMHTLVTTIAIIIAYRNEQEIRQSFLMQLILKPKKWSARIHRESTKQTVDSHKPPGLSESNHASQREEAHQQSPP